MSLLPLAAHAQAAFTNPYIEWNLRPDVPRVPYDGAPWSERYTNSFIFNNPPLMFGANPNGMWYAYHVDKINRAQAFGYRLPDNYYDPVTGQIVIPPPPPPLLQQLQQRHGLLWSVLHRNQ